jgi:hypothetical protein
MTHAANVLASLDSKLTPAAVGLGAPQALRVGATTDALTLFETFTRDVLDDTKVKTVIKMAGALSPSEFKDQCEKAKEYADTNDAAAGFVPSKEVRYGPVRRVLNQRLSEACQIFGAFKLAPQVVQEKGYVSALNAARTFLAEKGLKWDGSNKPTESDKEAKLRTKLIAEVMGKNPLMSLEQVQAEAATRLELVQGEEFNTRVKKAVDDIEKKHGSSFLMAMIQLVIDTSDTDTLMQLGQYVNDAQTILTLEQEKQFVLDSQN